MAEKCFPLENTEYTAADAQLWFATRTSGVYAGTHLPVSADGTMNLTAGSGIAWLHYDMFAGVVYANTENRTLTVDMSDAQYNRIDRVCIRLEQLNDRCYLYVKKGTAASNPVPPDLQRDNVAYEISIAQVLVRVGVVGINAGDITDERLDSNVCGLMRDGVTGVDTSVINAQFVDILSALQNESNEILDELKENIQIVYDGIALPNVSKFKGTLMVDGWSAEKPYHQEITANGVLGNDEPEVDVDLSGAYTADEMEALNEAWLGGILKATPVANGVVFYFADVPDIDIPVKIKVVR